jgi:hypothetical protein
MSKVINRVYDDSADALEALRALETAGISHNDISIVANNVDNKWDPTHKDAAAKGAGAGAATGAALGGGAGLLAGLGMLAIPGIGPVVAAGWLAATAAGAAVGATAGAAGGGIIGKLTEHEVDKEDVEFYAEAIRRGGALISVKADNDEIAKVEAILDESNFIDADARRAAYRADDWNTFNPDAPAYSQAQVDAERLRYQR